MSFNPAEHMMPLKGKEYLPVAWRLVWFREERPLWSITTEMLSHDTETKHCVFRAVISDENGAPVSCGHGSESARDFGDYIEKAETKAVGRALAMLGYGTQFAPELDEEERIVDSPVERKKPALVCQDCGSVLEPIKGKNGKVVSPEQQRDLAVSRFGRCLCAECIKKAQAIKNQNTEDISDA